MLEADTNGVLVYPEWGKTPRLNDYAKQMLITEKIDGTNALIQILPAGEGLSTEGSCTNVAGFSVRAGSRTRWLEPGKGDNFGFAGWVYEHAHELVNLGLGKHYGEWWGQGIQRRYGLEHKRFSLFRWFLTDPPPEVRGLDVVPVLYDGPIDLEQIEACRFMLSERGSVAAPGYNRPEGLVVWISGQRWKLVMDK